MKGNLTTHLVQSLAAAFCLAQGGMVLAAPASQPRELRVVVVVGAEGDQEYRPRFANEAGLWQAACQRAGVACEVVGLVPLVPETNDAALLKTRLEEWSNDPEAPLWLVLIGHGTFDGREAKFNLRGPDINADDLAGWMKPFSGDVAVIQTASASAPFLKPLAGPRRVLISATKSADEVFYTRFGQYFAEAVSGAQEPDLDQDGQVSLLEAFLWSSKQVQRFFTTEGRLATEHALLEDSGDGVGSRAEWFEGVRAIQTPAGATQMDGMLARQWCLLLSPADALLSEDDRLRRDELEREVETLRARKATMAVDDYYVEMERLLLQIARIYGKRGGS